MKRTIIFILIALAVIPASAQFNIIPSRDSRDAIPKGNITYFLPMTELHFSVEVRREVSRPGRFAAFAEQMLGISNVYTAEKTRYYIKDIRMTTSTEADPSRQYYLARHEGSRKGGEEVAVLGENGILIYYGRNSFAPRNAAPHDHLSEMESPWISLQDHAASVPMDVEKLVRDTVYRTIQREDTVIRMPSIQNRKSVKSEEELAKEAADKIMQLEESRYRLLTGYQEVPYTKEAIEYMDQSLSKAMKSYLSLFTGSKSIEKKTYTFSTIPALREDSLWVPLFRFSETEGAFNKNESRGDVIFIKCSSQKHSAPRNKLRVSEEQDETELRPKLWYRSPVLCKIELRDDRNTVYAGSTHVAQLGRVGSIPVDKVNIEFDPHSGQVIKVIFDE